MESNTDKIKEKESADVVVIGGGGTGMAAAVSAAEKTASVIVLEKQALGGNTALAQGFFAADSPVQKRQNITLSRDEAFRTAIEYSHWKINPRILRAFINKSGDTVRWLEDKGLMFERIATVYKDALPSMHCMEQTSGFSGGSDIVRTLKGNCEQLGVRIFTHCPAKKLLRDETGAISGVIAATRDREVKIDSRSVIIATGGFGGNQEFLKKYYPSYNENMHYHGIPHLRGDGLHMALEIGAATEGLGNLMLHHNEYMAARSINAFLRKPYTLWVNIRGERFADESVGSRSTECGNVLERQPDKCVYTLFDERIKNSILEEMNLGLQKGMPVRGPGGMELINMEQDLESEAERGEGVMISDSWDEIAQWMGARPEVLNATIEEYNSSCDQGYDAVFNKEQEYLQSLRSTPFYAIKSYMIFMTTLGGIKINHHMEVLDINDNPIAGLYAGGDCTGGWETDTYCMVLSGSGLGFALNSGRIAGENAADYIIKTGKS